MSMNEIAIGDYDEIRVQMENDIEKKKFVLGILVVAIICCCYHFATCLCFH